MNQIACSKFLNYITLNSACNLFFIGNFFVFLCGCATTNSTDYLNERLDLSAKKVKILQDDFDEIERKVLKINSGVTSNQIYINGVQKSHQQKIDDIENKIKNNNDTLNKVNIRKSNGGAWTIENTE